MKMPAISFGRYFGYPDCCIMEFLEYMSTYSKGKTPRREKRKLYGTGYVPCKKCNTKSEEQLLANIDKNREHNKAFPEDDLTNDQIEVICGREIN